MAKRILVKVTKADINNEQKLDIPISIPRLGIYMEYETKFPILLSIQRTINFFGTTEFFDLDTVVSYEYFWFYRKFKLPRSVKRAYSRWIKGKKIKPFNFYLVEVGDSLIEKEK